MKKVIICIIIILSFILVYGFTSCNTHLKIEKTNELCDNIIQSILTGNNTVSITGSDKIDNLINELENNENAVINLTEYFNYIINYEEFKLQVSKERPEATDEEIEKIYNSVLNYNPNFVEEETIYIDNNGNKCIKVKDLRRLSNNDGIIKYFNGEYIISELDIPLLYSQIKKKYSENKIYYCINSYEYNKNICTYDYFINDLGHIIIDYDISKNKLVNRELL